MCLTTKMQKAPRIRPSTACAGAKLKQSAVAGDIDYRHARGLDCALFHRLLGGHWIDTQQAVLSGSFKCADHVGINVGSSVLGYSSYKLPTTPLALHLRVFTRSDPWRTGNTPTRNWMI